MKTKYRQETLRFMEDDRDAGNEVIVKYGVRFQKFIWSPGSQLYSLAETRPPRQLGSYTRALLVSQDRRHLFVTLSQLIEDSRG
jgi:hypothetical protein